MNGPTISAPRAGKLAGAECPKRNANERPVTLQRRGGARRITVGISDPAKKTHEFHEKRDGRVRCIPWFERPVNDLQTIGKKVKILVAIPNRFGIVLA